MAPRRSGEGETTEPLGGEPLWVYQNQWVIHQRCYLKQEHFFPFHHTCFYSRT